MESCTRWIFSFFFSKNNIHVLEIIDTKPSSWIALESLEILIYSTEILPSKNKMSSAEQLFMVQCIKFRLSDEADGESRTMSRQLIYAGPRLPAE